MKLFDEWSQRSIILRVVGFVDGFYKVLLAQSGRIRLWAPRVLAKSELGPMRTSVVGRAGRRYVSPLPALFGTARVPQLPETGHLIKSLILRGHYHNML